MKKIVISEVISQGWELTKKHWLVLLICMIVMSIINSLLGRIGQPGEAEIMALGQPDPNNLAQYYMSLFSLYNPAATFLTTILYMMMSIGFYQIVLNCTRSKGEFTIQAWAQPIMTYVNIIIANIIIAIVCVIGLICCILPGIYLMARLQFTTYYLLDHKDASCIDAIKASWAMTQENGIQLSLLCIVYFLIEILGFLCCLVGIFPAAMVVYLSGAVCYLTLNNSNNE